MLLGLCDDLDISFIATYVEVYAFLITLRFGNGMFLFGNIRLITWNKMFKKTEHFILNLTAGDMIRTVKPLAFWTSLGTFFIGTFPSHCDWIG